MKRLADAFIEHAFTVLAFAIFGLLFAMRPSTWLPTLIILVCSLWALGSAEFRAKLAASLNSNDLRYISWPLLTWFLTCLFLGLWHFGFETKALPDNALRMALALTTFALVVHAYARKYFLLGLVVAGFCVGLNVAFGFLIFDKYLPRISGTTNHPIHFGNFSMLLAVLLVTVALLVRTSSKSFRVVCLSSALFACVGSVASQSRSSVGLLLCLIPLVFIIKTDSFHKWVIRCVVILFLAISALISVSPLMQEKLRLKEAVVDIEQVAANNYQTSIGARLTMWHAAWLMFKENPLLGIGTKNFETDFKRRVENHEVQMGDVFHLQPHNDLLHAASSGGLLKLAAYLFLIAGPFVFFYKQYRSYKFDLDRRVFPMMGMQVVAAVFVTGLTNSNFDLQIYSTVYAVSICVLARLSLFEINANETSIR